MNTYIVIIEVSRNNYRYAQVVSAIRADSEQEAIHTASQGWIWNEEDDYEIEVKAVKLNGEAQQVISHQSF